MFTQQQISFIMIEYHLLLIDWNKSKQTKQTIFQQNNIKPSIYRIGEREKKMQSADIDFMTAIRIDSSTFIIC